MRKLALHWKILIGMVIGILFGLAMTSVDGGATFVSNWINPFGNIFVKLLKLIAVPLIIASLVKGISDLKDISKFKNIGLKTIGIYIGTTVIAITIGLLLVNIVSNEIKVLTFAFNAIVAACLAVECLVLSHKCSCASKKVDS